MKGLTIKQENFCNYHIIENGNATKAYRRAFSCSNMKNETVNRCAFELLNTPKIAARIEELRSEIKEKLDITKEMVLTELSAILQAKITDYVEFDGVTVRFKSFDKLSETQIKAIESIKETRNGIELKLHGKSWTIERICKMLGFDSPTKNILTGENGEPIQLSHKIEDHKVIFEDYKENA